MTTSRFWILGAADPEMSAIESLLVECGEHVAHARIGGAGGHRVTSGEAYRADCHRYITDCGEAGDATETWYLVECAVPTPAGCPVVRVDHHRPGDLGYGVPPSEFMRGSSLGQVISELARLDILPASWYCGGMSARPGSAAGVAGYLEYHVYSGCWFVVDHHRATRYVPHELVLTAAADHCLGAAYAGQCPGVDPDELMHWRAESRAAFQGRSVDEILADVAIAKVALESAPMVTLLSVADMPHTSDHDWSSSCCDGCNRDPVECRDMRSTRGATGCDESHGYDACAPSHYGPRLVPELVEAGTRYGIAYVADGLPTHDGRAKVVCSGPPEVIEAFLSTWAPCNGLVDCYGDSARGFAGGYLA